MNFSQLITRFVSLRFKGIRWTLRNCLLARIFRKKPVSLEQIKGFLDFTTLSFIKRKLLLWTLLLPFLEVDWIYMKDTYQC